MRHLKMIYKNLRTQVLKKEKSRLQIKNTYINKIWYEKGNDQETQWIQRIIRAPFKNLYSIILNNLKEIHIFLKTYNLSKLNHDRSCIQHVLTVLPHCGQFPVASTLCTRKVTCSHQHLLFFHMGVTRFVGATGGWSWRS